MTTRRVKDDRQYYIVAIDIDEGLQTYRFFGNLAKARAHRDWLNKSINGPRTGPRAFRVFELKVGSAEEKA